MSKLIINSYDEFAAHLGEELGASEWLQVDQDRINLFADATLDHQWIHVDYTWIWSVPRRRANTRVPLPMGI